MISCTVYPTDIDICVNRPIIRRSQKMEWNMNLFR